MQKIDRVAGNGIPLLLDDIDTDRIIPARFLRCVSFEGIGEHAFEDDREQDPTHPFSDPRFQGASILVAGRNFGCGSSREHAPQSLMRWGIKAIAAESFAEIFFGNCTSLGIPAVTVGRKDLETLNQRLQSDSKQPMSVDLTTLTITCGDWSCPCALPDSVRNALVSGQWDFLGQLLEGQSAISEKRNSLPYLSGFGT